VAVDLGEFLEENTNPNGRGRLLFWLELAVMTWRAEGTDMGEEGSRMFSLWG
jgi:hypothetical protein